MLRLAVGEVDLVRGLVMLADGGQRKLTTRETALLDFLARHPHGDIPRETLLSEVWGHHPDSLSRAVDHTMRRLRAKVEARPSDPQHLLTVHGVGYRFVPMAAPVHPRSDGGFIGRSAELQALADATALHRIVQVLGPGGVGKTRLVREWMPETARFVDLSSATSEAEVSVAVARALGVPVRRLSSVLEDSVRELVLDNAEQVASGLSDWLLPWIHRGPRVVVTSRVRLDLPGGVVSLDGLPAADAVALFRQIAAGFGVTVDDSPTLVQVVDRLDRLPLALELAAARARVLGPADLLQRLLLPRLDRRFTALGRRTHGPTRHATLSAAIAWSWDLLTEAQRHSLVRLSVFEGGASLDAAEAVLGDRALEDLSVLVDASLVVARSTDGGGRRFGLLESIRAYALDADAAVFEDGKRRHHQYFRRASAVWSTEVGRSPEARRRLSLERDNLLSAWRHSVSQGLADLELVEALALVLESEGPPELWARLTASVRRQGPVAERLEAWRLLAIGDAVGAEAVLDRAEDTATPARALLLGRIRRARRDFPAAARHLQAGLSSAEPGGRLAAALVHQLAILRIDEGDWSTAEQHARAALRAWRVLGHDTDAATAWLHLGHIALEVGDIDGAIHRYSEAHTALTRLGDRRRAAISSVHLALALLETAHPQDARTPLDAGAAVLRQVGDRRLSAFATLVRAELAMVSRDFASARQLAAAARARLLDLGDPAFSAAASARLALACLALRDDAGAVHAAEVARSRLSGPGAEAAKPVLDVIVAAAQGREPPPPSLDRPLHLPRRLVALCAVCTEARDVAGGHRM